MIKIVLIGPPGCGKGTQARKLIQKYRVAHVSSGDVLRTEVAAGASCIQWTAHEIPIPYSGILSLLYRESGRGAGPLKSPAIR